MSRRVFFSSSAKARGIGILAARYPACVLMARYNGPANLKPCHHHSDAVERLRVSKQAKPAGSASFDHQQLWSSQSCIGPRRPWQYTHTSSDQRHTTSTRNDTHSCHKTTPSSPTERMSRSRTPKPVGGDHKIRNPGIYSTREITQHSPRAGGTEEKAGEEEETDPVNIRTHEYLLMKKYDDILEQTQNNRTDQIKIKHITSRELRPDPKPTSKTPDPLRPISQPSSSPLLSNPPFTSTMMEKKKPSSIPIPESSRHRKS